MSQVMPDKVPEKSFTFDQAQNVNLKMANLSWDLFIKTATRAFC